MEMCVTEKKTATVFIKISEVTIAQ